MPPACLPSSSTRSSAKASSRRRCLCPRRVSHAPAFVPKTWLDSSMTATGLCGPAEHSGKTLRVLAVGRRFEKELGPLVRLATSCIVVFVFVWSVCRRFNRGETL